VKQSVVMYGNCFDVLLEGTIVYHFSAPFFVECISEQDLDEMNIEIIRNTLYKVTWDSY